jgi:hypothetical protein
METGRVSEPAFREDLREFVLCVDPRYSSATALSRIHAE